MLPEKAGDRCNKIPLILSYYIMVFAQTMSWLIFSDLAKEAV
jgi:hypothetical protein